MDTPSEDTNIAHVVDRLAARFPAARPEEVQQVVSEVHRGFTGNRIRDFVPVLVEHDARDALRRKHPQPH